MHIVPTLILWSITWFPLGGVNDQSSPELAPTAARQRVEILASPSYPLELASCASEEALSPADLGAMPSEDDDLIESQALDLGPCLMQPDSDRSEAEKHLLPRRPRVDSSRCLFSIRC